MTHSQDGEKAEDSAASDRWPEAALVSVCRSPLGEWHDAAPAGRYSAKAI